VPPIVVMTPHEGPQVVAGAALQFGEHGVDVHIACGIHPLLQVHDIEVLNGGADMQGLQLAHKAIDHELVIQLLQRAVSVHPSRHHSIGYAKLLKQAVHLVHVLLFAGLDVREHGGAPMRLQGGVGITRQLLLLQHEQQHVLFSGGERQCAARERPPSPWSRRPR
jgi:hypothetical protein